MFIFGNLLRGLAMVIDFVLVLFMWIVIARAILSWVNPNPFNSLVRSIIRFIYDVSEPVLSRIRAWIPVNFGGIDLSPIIVILGVAFLRIFLVDSLLGIAHRLL
jgi:YggT family protein